MSRSCRFARLTRGITLLAHLHTRPTPELRFDTSLKLHDSCPPLGASENDPADSTCLQHVRLPCPGGGTNLPLAHATIRALSSICAVLRN